MTRHQKSHASLRVPQKVASFRNCYERVGIFGEINSKNSCGISALSSLTCRLGNNRNFNPSCI